MPRQPRDRAAGYVTYPGDWRENPLYLRLTPAERGVFHALRDALWETPEIGVIEDDDRTLASLALCSDEMWITARVAVARLFDLDSRRGFWVFGPHIDQHEALRRKHMTRANAGSEGGKATARNRGNRKPRKAKGSTATADAQQPVQHNGSIGAADAAAPVQRTENREQRTPPSLRSGGSNAPPTLRSGGAEPAVASPLRCEATAPAAPAAALRAAGETVHEARDASAPARGLVLDLAQQLDASRHLDPISRPFPNNEAWEWLNRNLPLKARPRPLMAFMATLWKDGVEDLELLQSMVTEVVEKSVENPYAYFAKGSVARESRIAAAMTARAEAETAQRNEEERRWLSSGR